MCKDSALPECLRKDGLKDIFPFRTTGHDTGGGQASNKCLSPEVLDKSLRLSREAVDLLCPV